MKVDLENEIIEVLKPKCNGYDLPLSLNIKLIAELLVDKQLTLTDVSQQRKLLNALADDFNEGTDTYIIQKTIEKTLKAFNCDVLKKNR